MRIIRKSLLGKRDRGVVLSSLQGTHGDKLECLVQKFNHLHEEKDKIFYEMLMEILLNTKNYKRGTDLTILKVLKKSIESESNGSYEHQVKILNLMGVDWIKETENYTCVVRNYPFTRMLREPLYKFLCINSTASSFDFEECDMEFIDVLRSRSEITQSNDVPF